MIGMSRVAAWLLRIEQTSKPSCSGHLDIEEDQVGTQDLRRFDPARSVEGGMDRDRLVLETDPHQLAWISKSSMMRMLLTDARPPLLGMRHSHRPFP